MACEPELNLPDVGLHLHLRRLNVLDRLDGRLQCHVPTSILRNEQNPKPVRVMTDAICGTHRGVLWRLLMLPTFVYKVRLSGYECDLQCCMLAISTPTSGYKIHSPKSSNQRA
jgi:hypothetical protein